MKQHWIAALFPFSADIGQSWGTEELGLRNSPKCGPCFADTAFLEQSVEKPYQRSALQLTAQHPIDTLQVPGTTDEAVSYPHIHLIHNKDALVGTIMRLGLGEPLDG